MKQIHVTRELQTNQSHTYWSKIDWCADWSENKMGGVWQRGRIRYQKWLCKSYNSGQITYSMFRNRISSKMSKIRMFGEKRAPKLRRKEKKGYRAFLFRILEISHRFLSHYLYFSVFLRIQAWKKSKRKGIWPSGCLPCPTSSMSRILLQSQQCADLRCDSASQPHLCDIPLIGGVEQLHFRNIHLIMPVNTGTATHR